MKRKNALAQALVVDYSAAREQAIRWLGDRYLLARPINAPSYTGRKMPGDARFDAEQGQTPLTSS
jgi:hypothetical protein